MGTERNPRSQASRGVPPWPDRQRIPLPPLPDFRRPAAPAAPSPLHGTSGVSGEEADLLEATRLGRAGYTLPPGPGHEGRPAPLRDIPTERPGALGATILNDLVDEIEKDLEAEIERHSDASATPGYGRVVGCSFSPAAARGAKGNRPGKP